MGEGIPPGTTNSTKSPPATNQIEELQGRCIPTSMGSWRRRLKASQPKNLWKNRFWVRVIFKRNKHNKLTFDMDNKKTTKNFCKKPFPNQTPWTCKVRHQENLFNKSIEGFMRASKKNNNFGKVVSKLWGPQLQANLCHIFLSNRAYSL